MNKKNEIVLYTIEDESFSVEVQIGGDTVWLTQKQMAELFDKDQSVISRHINNVFNENELEEKSNMQKMHIANSDKPIIFYSLDVIISVGYRVKSKRGTQFRIWANKILKDYLLKGYSINNATLKKYPDGIEHLKDSINFLTTAFEDKEKKQIVFQIETNKKFNKIFKTLKTQDEPKQGIFFQGQIFDAYKFVLKLIRTAKNSLIIIDNYIDETVLAMCTEIRRNVKLTIVTKELSNKQKLDIIKYHSQYFIINLKETDKFHDRFMLIDSKEVYHFGASLKDLGKKCFAFSKIEDTQLIRALLKMLEE